MRSQYRRKRFGLVFGAGVNKDLKIPDWQELLKRIASHKDVDGSKLSGWERASPSRKAELLRHHFNKRMRLKLNRDLDEREAISELSGLWLRIIRDVLYRGLKSEHELEDRHPYLRHYLDIILGCGITVNYNFDSCIEMMLSNRQKRLGMYTRPFEVAYGDFLATGVQAALVYHPNGYLPKNVLEGCSSEIVFSEHEFNQQMADILPVGGGFLTQHFAEKTFLFLGLSLEDDSLKGVLQRAGKANPGQYHYYVEFVESDDLTRDTNEEALHNTWFDNYNLITLSLTSDQIAALGHLILMDRNQFLHLAEQAKVNTAFTYYLTGVPGVGKTSIIRHFHSLHTYGKWAEEPLPELETPFQELTSKQKDFVDRWFARQYALKNEELCRAREGIHLVEGTPLDPLSFMSRPEWPAKAGQMHQMIQDQCRDAGVKKGSIIHLVGEPREIAARLSIQHRMTHRPEDEAYPPGKLEEIDAVLSEIYPKDDGVSKVHTRGISLPDVVRKVAEVVFSDKYPEFDIDAKLQNYADAPVA